MDLFGGMEAFCRLVETGSFGKAASRMGVAKSVVANRLAQLEAHLGVALFHRSTRAIQLSEAGRRYYAECAELLARAQELTAHGGAQPAALAGKLSIQVLPGFAVGHLSAALIEFTQAHPAINFDVTVSDRLVDPVHEGVDVVFQIYPAVSDSLIERRLFPNRGVFCAAPAYLDRAPPLEAPEDLIRHRFARYANYPWDDRWPFFDRTGARTEVQMTPVLKSNSVQFLTDYVLGGGAVAYLPTMLAAPHLRSGALVRVLPDHAPPEVWVSAVYPPSHRSTAKVRAFLDWVCERFAGEPRWDEGL